MFRLSPGVNVSEIDAATGIPAVSTTQAGFAGVFRWGPVAQRTLVTSEPDLVTKFHKPTNLNAETWFTAANFLGYGNQLQVVRAESGTSAMAVFSGTTAPNAATQTIKNRDHYDSGAVTFSANVAYVAKYPGELGNSLRVSVCDSAAAYNSLVDIVANSSIAATSNVSISVGSSVATVSVGFSGTGNSAIANTQAFAIKDAIQVGDNIKVGNSTIGEQFLQVASVGSVSGNSTIFTFSFNLSEPYRLRENWASTTLDRYWEFHNVVTAAPGTSDYVEAFGNTAAVDEVHLVVVDENGAFSGVPGSILEVYNGLSRATNAKTENGAVNYYKEVLNTNSQYIWWANDATIAPSAPAATVASASSLSPTNYSMVGGTDGPGETGVPLGSLAAAYDLLGDADDVDISLVIAGKARESDGATLVNYIIDNVSEKRRDCVAFASPPKEMVVNNTGNEVTNVVNFANDLRATSYGFLDSGYKYQYDKYNDIYRWVPLNGDIAGLCVRTDRSNDPWFSPAGYNRGRIRNVTKLAWNPSEAARELLSKASVNAVIKEEGEGFILFDDRTLLKKNSPFRALGVRRLFIILQKAIATDAKYTLFEFNDDFTRAQFRNRTIPYLRDIQGRRGILSFEVVCDETNNTDEVIDREEFVGDIYIRPNRSIRGIQLNFVAVRGSVRFDEIVGQF
jgi:hypothetical protein